MSTIRHHAIIVTGSADIRNGEFLHKAIAHAKLLGMVTTDLVSSPLNNICTFTVVPDGSYEEWTESDSADQLRSSFREYLNSLRYEDGLSPLEWVEVVYGDHDGECEIVSHEFGDRPEED